MNIETSQVTKLSLTDLHRLDPVAVIAEDIKKGHGKITITCYGKAWTYYWGGMGLLNIRDFFVSCDESYLTGKLSHIKSTIYDIDAIREKAEEKNIGCWRDDPWNDYEFMTKMCGDACEEWHDAIPKMPNPKYRYLCRIIKAVQDGFKQLAAQGA